MPSSTPVAATREGATMGKKKKDKKKGKKK
ncbi:MAG: hypothetical protein QOG99_3665, partial [Frankiales bacterium]|nr:hypothetical protein [Frankiales bacterium]